MARHRRFLLSITLALTLPAFAAASPESTRVQQAWDQTNFAMTGDAQAEAMKQLVSSCDTSTAQQPGDVELLIWCGITNSTYAGLAGSFSAMKYAKAARVLLEKAIELSPSAMNGEAMTSLGTLYFKVPGWPIGFGDSDKARELLEAGLALNPHGIDANFFYADFLLEEKNTAAARKSLELAMNAPSRPGRDLADQGRRKQIQSLLDDLDRQ